MGQIQHLGTTASEIESKQVCSFFFFIIIIFVFFDSHPLLELVKL